MSLVPLKKPAAPSTTMPSACVVATAPTTAPTKPYSRARLFATVAAVVERGEANVPLLVSTTGCSEARARDAIYRVSRTLDAYAEAEAVSLIAPGVDRASLVAALLVRSEIDGVGDRIVAAIDNLSSAVSS